MVTAKYTEKTELQPVDFTQAAAGIAQESGKAAEMRMKIADRYRQQSAQKLTEMAKVNAQVRGAEAGAEGRFETGSMMTEAGKSYNVGLASSATLTFSNDAAKHFGQSFAQVQAQGYSPQAYADYQANVEGYTQRTLDATPPLLRETARKALQSINHGYELQYQKGLQKSLTLQAAKTARSTVEQSIATSNTLAANGANLLTDTAETLKKQVLTTHQYIDNNPNISAAQSATYKKRLYTESLGHTVGQIAQSEFARLQELMQNGTPEQIIQAKQQLQTINRNPNAFVDYVQTSLNKRNSFYGTFANTTKVASQLKTLTGNFLTQGAAVSDAYQNTYNVLVNKLSKGAFLTPNEVTTGQQAAAMLSKSEIKLLDFNNQVAGQEMVQSALGDANLTQQYETGALENTLGLNKAGNNQVLNQIKALKTLNNRDPAAYTKKMALEKNAYQATTSQLIKDGARPADITYTRNALNSPTILTDIAQKSVVWDRNLGGRILAEQRSLYNSNTITGAVYKPWTTAQLNNFVQTLNSTADTSKLVGIWSGVHQAGINTLDLFDSLPKKDQTLLTLNSALCARDTTDSRGCHFMIEAAQDKAISALSQKENTLVHIASGAVMTKYNAAFSPEIAALMIKNTQNVAGGIANGADVGELGAGVRSSFLKGTDPWSWTGLAPGLETTHGMTDLSRHIDAFAGRHTLGGDYLALIPSDVSSPDDARQTLPLNPIRVARYFDELTSTKAIEGYQSGIYIKPGPVTEEAAKDPMSAGSVLLGPVAQAEFQAQIATAREQGVAHPRIVNDGLGAFKLVTSANIPIRYKDGREVRMTFWDLAQKLHQLHPNDKPERVHVDVTEMY